MKKFVVGVTLLIASSGFAADTWVQLPTDASNTGKKSASVSKTDGSDTVLLQRHVIEDPATLNQAGVTSGGALKVDTSSTSASNGTASGSLTNGSTVSIPLAGYYSVSTVISGVYTVATFVPEVSSDGTNWIATQFYSPTTQAYSTTVSANGSYVIANVGAMAQVRIRCSAMATGSATVTLLATTAQANSLTAQGANTKANSVAVNIASDQIVPSTTTTALQSAAGIYATNTANNELRVTEIPSQLMVDGFDTALDTTSRWNAATLSGTGAALAVASGNLVVTLPSTAGYAYTTSIPSFTDTTPGQLRFAYNIQLEATPYVASTYRFWGAGTPQAAPTTAGCPACSNTMVDAVGFEVNTDQKLYAVIYKSGVRTQIADLSAIQPSDAVTHNYSIFYRPVKTHWYIDSQEVPVASSTLVQASLNKDSFPAVYAGVQGATTVATISSNTMSVSDTARNNQSVSDGVYAFRKATVAATNVIAPTASLDVAPAIAVSALSAATAGRGTSLTTDATNGSLNVRITDSATYLSPQVAASNALAASSALATMPAIGINAITATTAGRSAALKVDATTGFQVVNIADTSSYLKVGVLANDTTAITNGMLALNYVARATPTAVTAGRGELGQVDTVTGGQFVEEVATTSATGLSSTQIAVNTSSSIKASAGNVYGFSVANASASVCYLQFYNSSAPTCGTSVISSYALPVTPGVLNITSNIPLGNYSTAIGTCVSTTPTGGTTCGSVIGGLTVLYK